MNTPHDALFKHVFQQREHAVGVLRHALPEAVARQIDWSTLHLEAGSVVDDELEPRHADLLYSVRLAGREAFLFLLLEHKSKPDELTVLQVLTYMVRIWERFCGEHPDAVRLPAILPIVIHHGEGGWTRATNLLEVLDLPDDLRAVLGRHLPSLELIVLDLAAESSASLHDYAASALARLALFCLKRARQSPDLIAELSGWVDVVRQVYEAPGGSPSLVGILVYIMQQQDQPRERLTRFLTAAAGPDVEEAVTTTYDRLIQQGRAEGRTEGRTEGCVDLMLRQLEARFGVLPDTVSDRIRSASVEQLDSWAVRLLTAETIDAVFAAD